MLTISNLAVRYGAIQGVRGISLDVKQGEIVALIGSNGAGKSTTVRAIAGLLPFTGDIVYEGNKLRPNTAEKNLRAGIALVPEGRGILGRMSVEENLQMGIYCRSDHAEAQADIERMYERFPILRDRKHNLASLLSGGEQQMLAIARALMSKPSLLLLDEPSLGLAPLIVKEVFAVVRRLGREGMTILLVEQMANQALAIADQAYVLETGRITLSGTGAQLLADPRVRQAYLGA